MIRLGKVQDLDLIAHLEDEVIIYTKDILTILDEEYGTYRDIDKDLGGYIATVENEMDMKTLKKLTNLDIKANIPEWIEEISCNNGANWRAILFIMSCDYSVQILTKNDKIKFMEV